MIMPIIMNMLELAGQTNTADLLGTNLYEKYRKSYCTDGSPGIDFAP